MQTNTIDNSHQRLVLFIEGKEYHWSEQYITGREIRALANLDPQAMIYLNVVEPWKDEHILDERRVDLARPEAEYFYILQKLPYTINGEHFESTHQYIRGKHIRKQGKIPADHEIFLSIPGPWEDEHIADNEFVNLARPGTEGFYSKEKKHEFVLIVNGKEKAWHARKISYEQVVQLAYGDVPECETRVYTVTFKRGPEQNPQGSMVKRDEVFVKNKMIFNVSCTDKS